MLSLVSEEGIYRLRILDSIYFTFIEIYNFLIPIFLKP